MYIQALIKAIDKNVMPRTKRIFTRKERFSMIVISVGCGFFSSSSCFVSSIKFGKGAVNLISPLYPLSLISYL